MKAQAWIKDNTQEVNSSDFVTSLDSRRFSQTCPRCEGLIVREDLCDMKDSCDPLWITGFRCANCGFIGERVIDNHHKLDPKHDSYPQPRRRRGFNRLNPIRKA